MESHVKFGQIESRQPAACQSIEEQGMLLTAAIVLFVLWVLARVAFKVTSGFIHILLVIGLIVLVLNFLRP
jgi:Flp pilus assembly protein TadB